MAGGYPSTEMQSVYSVVPTDGAGSLVSYSKHHFYLVEYFFAA